MGKTKPFAFDAMMLNSNDGETMATELDTKLSADSEPMVDDSHNMLDTENNINTLDPFVDCRIDIERLHYHFKHRKVEPNFHMSDDVNTTCKSEYFEEDTKEDVKSIKPDPDAETKPDIQINLDSAGFSL